MSSYKALSIESWRRTAWFNVLFIFVLEISLVILLAISASRHGSSLFKSTIIYEGSCDSATKLNLTLHIVINLIASAVAASSNYFMQVLSSPSRMEIDKAHSKFQALAIGRSSLHNLRFVSGLKSFSWFVLLASSAPIHLFFNSAVFETIFQGSEWQMTIGTESLVNGTAFFPPGASLAASGSWMPLCKYFQLKSYDSPDGIYYCWHTEDDGSTSFAAELGFGDATPLDQYWNASSPIRRTLDSTVHDSKEWVHLTSDECINEYGQAKPREKYGDVMLVVDTQTQSRIGWTRNEIFNLTSPNDLEIWDPHIPADALNPLWYSTHCRATKFWYFLDGLGDSNCEELFGSRLRYLTSHASIPFDSTDHSIFPYPAILTDQARELGYQYPFQALDLRYCLAQPLPGRCKVGVSNAILLITIISMSIKLTQAAIVAWRLPRRSLVTLGDAIESFILEPDLVTIGQSALDIRKTNELKSSKYLRTEATVIDEAGGSGPDIWDYAKPRRLNSAVSLSSWVCSFVLFTTAIILLAVGLFVSIMSSKNPLPGSFGRSNQNLVAMLGQPGYVGALLLANLPQLLLSVCYFTYNSICTRLCVELEWNSYATSYRPLRVSYPKGQQTTTYRLQVPYRYGIPLFAISAILHWLLSNAVFIFISEGGYWKGGNGPLLGVAGQLGLSKDSIVAVGYSPPAILALFISALVVVSVPLLIGLRKLPSDKKMVIGGSNSLVISAACHCYASATFPLQWNQTSASPVNNILPEIEQQRQFHSRLPGSRLQSRPQETGAAEITRSNDIASGKGHLQAIARSVVRWGAMQCSENYQEWVGAVPSEQQIMHLGFGCELDEVCEPILGQRCV